MKKLFSPLLLVLASCALLSACSLRIDITNLTPTPHEDEEGENEGENQEQEGEEQNQDVDPNDPDARFKVSSDFFNANIRDGGLLLNQSFTAESYHLDENDQQVSHVTHRIDHNKMHTTFELLNSDVSYDTIYINLHDNHYDYYFIQTGNDYHEEDREMNVFDTYDEYGLLFRKAFSEHTFDATTKAYKLANYQREYVDHGQTVTVTATNVSIYFEENVLKRVMATVRRTRENSFDETLKVDYSITSWGTTTVHAPELSA